MDPFAGFLDEPHSLHKYLYVGADPVNLVDPSGMAETASYWQRVKDQVRRTVDYLNRHGRDILCKTINTSSIILSIPGAVEGLASLTRKAVEWGLEFCACEFGGGPGGKGGDIVLTRFGRPSEPLEKLAREAADAKKKIGIHGVSTTSRPKYPGAPSAPKSEVEKHFPVHKTGGPGHYTVELPEPVTQAVADLFNLIFRRCK